MFARVTTVEIDPVRVDVGTAVERFRSEVLPALGHETGFAGALLLSTDEGHGLVVSFWDTADQADASKENGFYSDILGRFVTLFRSPPGRERYEVAFMDVPGRATR